VQALFQFSSGIQKANHTVFGFAAGQMQVLEGFTSFVNEGSVRKTSFAEEQTSIIYMIRPFFTCQINKILA
jgi:hypothetical protein